MTSSSALIRPTDVSDLKAIAAIADATNLFPGDMLGGMIAGYLDRSNDDIWLTAEIDGEPVGFGFCEPERLTTGTWNLLAIGVLPDRQSRGIGAALIAHLENALRLAGHRILIVETIGTQEFARTHAFYLANGYVEEARLREFWDAGTDKLVFWKHLQAARAPAI